MVVVVAQRECHLNVYSKNVKTVHFVTYSGKEPAYWRRRLGFEPWVGKIPWGEHGNHSSILA